MTCTEASHLIICLSRVDDIPVRTVGTGEWFQKRRYVCSIVTAISVAVEVILGTVTDHLKRTKRGFRRMETLSIDWHLIISNLLYIALSYALAMPVAWNREREARGVGLRTFPLVSIAACGYTLLASSAFAGHVDAQARVLQGLIPGIGFIGGGAILKIKEDVRGVATAASIWATGAIGAAVAFRRFEVAILISLVTFVTFWVMDPIKEKLNDNESKDTSTL